MGTRHAPSLLSFSFDLFFIVLFFILRNDGGINFKFYLFVEVRLVPFTTPSLF